MFRRYGFPPLQGGLGWWWGWSQSHVNYPIPTPIPAFLKGKEFPQWLAFRFYWCENSFLPATGSFAIRMSPDNDSVM